MTMLRTSTTSEARTETPPAQQRAGTFGEGLARIARFDHRCPDCDGPLVFGEGCSLCPICGRSSCA